LIQTCGRAARNVNGKVIMYADHVTESMRHAMSETERRRLIQEAYNETHGITPQTIQKEIVSIFGAITSETTRTADRIAEITTPYTTLEDMEQSIRDLEKEMMAAAKDMDFERAADLRDRIRAIKSRMVFEGTP
jgi:excinuclease ABC subunit B